MSDIVERLRAWVYTDSQYATAREAADEIERLREAVRRLADQDATLSVVGGNVIVEMDATPWTLTDAERGALEQAIWRIEQHYPPGRAVVLRALLDRTK